LSCSCCCAADGFAEPALLAAAGLLLPLRVILIQEVYISTWKRVTELTSSALTERAVVMEVMKGL
jgi:hypothetical protein